MNLRELKPGQSAVITAVGGEGKAFLLDGQNHDPQPPYVAETGWGPGRIEATERTERTVFRLEITLE